MTQVHDVYDCDLSSRYGGLIFDCDGTLTDSMPLHFVAWRETMKAHGVDFTESRFYSMGGMPTEKIIATLSQEQAVDVPVAIAAEAKEQAFVEMMHRLQPLEAVCEIARQHHGRLPIAVASGGLRPIIKQQLEQVGLAEFFDVVVTSEDTELHKPEPDVFLHTARKLGVDPAKCLVFEDSPLGFEAAERAGMDFVDVRG